MNNIEVLGNIFMVEDGILKILLLRKKREPYKGYWILPREMVAKNKTLEEVLNDTVYKKVGLNNLCYEQVAFFSEIDRFPNKRVIGASFLALVDEVTVKTHQKDTSYEYSWFSIAKLPKIGYDHIKVIDRSINILRQKLNQSDTLKKFFPSDFTLPEIQRVYEQVLTKEFDRRNFRKKFLKLDLIETTGEVAPSTSGRPAKLYRFKQNIDNIILF